MVKNAKLIGQSILLVLLTSIFIDTLIRQKEIPLSNKTNFELIELGMSLFALVIFMWQVRSKRQRGESAEDTIILVFLMLGLSLYKWVKLFDFPGRFLVDLVSILMLIISTAIWFKRTMSEAYCPKCGTKVSIRSDQYCRNCGSLLGNGAVVN